MVEYQHAYDAAAKAMMIMDEVLDTVILKMGVTGR
jgi:flagellar hook-associated protein FlgK